MEKISCIICGENDSREIFRKPSRHGEMFRLVQCRRCGLQYISPRPEQWEMERYYGAQYFTTRTERGYDNYFSGAIRSEVERVFALNLRDLKFFEFEKGLPGEKNCLDIGCAAGYFVDFMGRRGWSSAGIDVSAECVDFARSAGLDVVRGDYLKEKFSISFDCITLWASIEHLHHPHLFLEKAHHELKTGGMLYISTCRAGGLNFMRLFGSSWRFYNFPEHLYYFSRCNMYRLLQSRGFEVTAYRTYGSGLGRPGSLLRRVCDFVAKRLYMGDMMILAARKK